MRGLNELGRKANTLATDARSLPYDTGHGNIRVELKFELRFEFAMEYALATWASVIPHVV